MTAALLDTSAYSAHVRGHELVVAAVAKLERVGMSPIVLGELRSGFLRGTRTKANEATLRGFLASDRALVLPVDDGTAERYAVILRDLLERGRPLPTNDIWIAATAMQHGLPVLTLDRDFQQIRQVLVECFEPA